MMPFTLRLLASFAAHALHFTAAAETVHVAVAANFSAPMKALAAAVEAETGHKALLSTGATGKLYAQARAAPFDVFLAADAATPERLSRTVPPWRVALHLCRWPAGAVVGPARPGDAAGAVLETCDFSTSPWRRPSGALWRGSDRGLWRGLRSSLQRGSPPREHRPAFALSPAAMRNWALLRFAGAGERRMRVARLCRPRTNMHRCARCGAPGAWPVQPAAAALLAYCAASASAHDPHWGYGPSDSRSALGPCSHAEAGHRHHPHLLLATPLAWWLARTGSRWRAPVGAIVALPLVLPPTVLGFYLLVAMGPDGPVGRLTQALGIGLLPFSFGGLVVGSIFYSLPFVVQPLANAFDAIGEQPLEAAATLRASPLDTFFSVALPLARPGYLTATVMGFAHTVGEFGVVLMIGGNIPSARACSGRSTTTWKRWVHAGAWLSAGCCSSRLPCCWRCTR